MPPKPPTQQMGESWLPVVGYEGLYEVSNLGAVRSLPRQTASGLRGGKVLRPAPGGAGKHLTVVLCREGKGSTRYVHKLVLEAFVGPCPAGQEGCHGPAGRLDNGVLNLSYGTRQQNSGPDRVRDGTDFRGDRSASAKLTWLQVSEIRSRYRYREGHPLQRDIAVEYGVDQSVISDIVTGRSWVPEGV